MKTKKWLCDYVIKWLVSTNHLFTYSLVHLFLFTYPLIYATNNGGLPAEYLLTFYPDARTAGLAGAATAISGSSVSMYYNPAGISSCFYNEITFFYTPLISGTKFAYISYLYPLASKEAIAASISVLSTPNIEKTNSIGETLYDFSSQEAVFNITYSAAIGESTDAGLNLKFLSQSIDDFTAHTVSADIGLLSDYDDTKYGLAVKNIIPLKLEKDKLPVSIRLGLRQRIYEKLFLSTDLAVDNVFTKSVRRLFFGSEYNYKIYSFRGGANYKELTAGVGVAEEKFSLDYAVSIHPLSITHRFSVALRFGIEPTKAEKYAVKLLEENKSKIEAAEKQLAEKRKDLDKDIEIFNTEKKKVEKLLMTDDKLKKEWQKIQTEKNQIAFELEIARKKQQIAQMLTDAQQYFDNKEYSKATDTVNRLLEQEPQNEPALLLFTKIRDMTTSTSAQEKYLKALQLYEQERFDDTIWLVQGALQINPTYTNAQVLLRQAKARNYISQQKYQDAKYELVEALKLKPDDTSVLELLKKVQTIIDITEEK
ncbi:MAG: PorV/PorQ family protein [Elusimicrobiota bacterium]